ncbi:fibronectin type III domain-containing protein [Epilithonimonas lactis]|uniref:fibronectin type III domain-containing protein n=1 Tax=Epilithonimonas lactis TaxID=421072 RepID=UPI00068B1ABD|nr:fibronectin type III domain-containing protein [Epilithonimonas lactis]SEQ70176.1 Serine protease, subtilisin family [Epilithonimonas lactis]
MKNFYRCCLLILIFSNLNIYSQDQKSLTRIQQSTKVDYLRTFSDNQRKQFDLSFNLANSLAEKNHWQKIIVTDSTYSRLVGVTKDLKPIYYITENRNAGITSRADRLYSGGSLGLSIEGQGMLAGVWDAGRPLLTHELFSNRISLMDNSPYQHPHASHVAGTIIGTDAVQNGNARGMAFKGSAKAYDWDNDIAEVANAAAAGLLISNHSYGYNPYYISVDKFGKYDQVSKDYDEILFNAPYFQMVCAAGNSRIYGVNTGKNGFDLITGHALGKNVITVAAVEEVLNYSGASSVVMSEFSSWGPSDDGRIKPDISAKGVHTFSAVNNSNSSYDYYDGTSMASPSVGGTLLLLQQYYNQLNNSYMKASTLKGLMIHSADEAGAAPGPDYKFGWGLINAEKAANIIKDKNLFSKVEENTINNGETKEIVLSSNGVDPLVVTVAWTDPVGNLPSNATDDPTPNLVNDLDILVSRDGVDYYPWKLNPANVNAAATKGVNNLDNVEKIEINTPLAGAYLLKINHKGNLVNQSQNYSLIASGIVTTDFWFNTADNNFKVCKSTSNDLAVNFDFHVKNGFSNQVHLSVLNLPAGLSATFSPSELSSEGNFILNLTGISTIQKGKYNFIIKGENGADSFEYPIAITVYDNVIAIPTLMTPANNDLSVNYINTEFTWTADSNTESYIFEISNLSDFSVKETYTTQINKFSKTLDNGTKYYWRVKGINTCGESDFSETNTFNTFCTGPTYVQLIRAGSNNLTVSWNTSNLSGKWEVEAVPAGQTPTGSGIIAMTNPYTITGLTKNTCYDIYVRVVCAEEGSYSSWVKGNNFCTNADYCDGDHFYDSGGANGNYAPSENFIKTIYPENSGDRITAAFNKFKVESCCSYFYIYDGPNESSPLLFSGSAMNQLPYTYRSTHPTGALTFRFYSYGVGDEGWDATILCEPKPACPTMPKNIALTASTPSSMTFNWEDTSNASQWEIEIVPAGTTPTGTGIVTSQKPYTRSGLTKNTCYDVYVRSLCTGGYSDWSAPARLCTSPDYCAGDHFYDSGGPNGNYKDYENWTKTIYPAVSGNRVRAVFNEFSLESCCDQLTIYNGPDSNSPVLFSSGYMSELPSSFRSTHSSGALTFAFRSDGSSVRSGWDAEIFCETIPACSEYPKSITLQSAALNSLTINWTDASNATQWELEVVKDGNSPTGVGTVISSKPYTITGLQSNALYKVYIRSLCSAGTSEWSVSKAFGTLADYCSGDHFYDTGGVSGGYSNNYESYTKTIYPSNTGDRVKAIFDMFDVYQYDQFTVYNGTNTSYNSVLYSSYGNSVPPSTLMSTDIATGALTFSFNTSGNINNKAGWDARIICEPMPPCPNAPGEITLQSSNLNALTVTWPENSNATQWEIEVVKDGNSPTGSGTLISTRPYTITGLQSNTCYRIYIRSVCSGGNSSWTVSKLFCTQGDYCGGDHFYDSGGALSGYPNNYENFVKTIYPSGNGNRVKAIFEMFDINQYDQFTVYNGPNTYSGSVLYNSSGNSTPPGTLQSTDVATGALTFSFYSSGNNNNRAGWDAQIICEPMPACPNPPTSINLQNAGLNSLTLNWTDNSNATQWEIEAVPDGSSPTGVGTLVSTRPYTIAGLQRNTCYKIYVRSVCVGGKSEWGVSKLFCTQANYCAGDHFYDLGGALSNYPNNESITKTIYPGASGNRVKAIFEMFDVYQYDQFIVYNGPYATSNSILYNSYNNTTPPGTLASTDVATGALTFVFYPYSSNNNPKAGWDAQIICEPMPPCANKPTQIVLESSSFNTLKFNWTENSSATQWEVELVATGSSPTGHGVIVTSKSYTVSDLLENTCYDVYVRSICSNGNSEWTRSSVPFCTLPNYCGDAHFYDSGGQNGYYSDNENWVKTIYPMSAGKLVSAKFTMFNLESCCDRLTIYNGPDILSPILFSSGTMNNLPQTFKSNNPTGALTFKFTSDSSATYPGWDALINCEENLSVAYNELENIKIFPNPVTMGILNISSPIEIRKYEIFDVSSKLILQKSVSEKDLKLDIGHLVSGSYVVRITDRDAKIHTFKIIKK